MTSCRLGGVESDVLLVHEESEKQNKALKYYDYHMVYFENR